LDANWTPGRRKRPFGLRVDSTDAGAIRLFSRTRALESPFHECEAFEPRDALGQSRPTGGSQETELTLRTHPLLTGVRYSRRSVQPAACPAVENGAGLCPNNCRYPKSFGVLPAPERGGLDLSRR